MSKVLIDARKSNPGWLYNSGVSTNKPFEARRLGDDSFKGKGPTTRLFNNYTPYDDRNAPDLFAEVFMNKVDNDAKSYFLCTELAIRTKDKTYCPFRDGTINKNKSCRIEEHEERAFYNYYMNRESVDTDEIRIIYYSMPLREDKPNEKKLKDVDAIGLSSDGHTAYLLELKNVESKETLVRSSLEIYTYYSRLGLNKADGKRKMLERLKNDFGSIFCNVTDIRPGILLINGSEQYKVFARMMSNEDISYSNIKRLIIGLGLDVFSVNKYAENTLIPFKSDNDVIEYSEVASDETKVRPVVKLASGEYIRIEKAY